MQQFDIALKVLLQRSAMIMRELTGSVASKWLNVELPKVQNQRVDLLFETGDGQLVHIELQSSNDPTMPLRMAEYYPGLYRLHDKFPRQILLYIGEAPLRMNTELRGPGLRFQYQAVDIRDLDGELLLESDQLGDNIIAILARLRDHRTAVRKVVQKIAVLTGAELERTLSNLLILASLRRLEQIVEQEAQQMPIFIDILENKVLGREYKRGLQEGERKGKLEGERTVLRRLIEKRFGPIPSWAEERLASRSTAELEELSVHLLDAQSLEHLLRQ